MNALFVVIALIVGGIYYFAQHNERERAKETAKWAEERSPAGHRRAAEIEKQDIQRRQQAFKACQAFRAQPETYSKCKLDAGIFTAIGDDD